MPPLMPDTVGYERSVYETEGHWFESSRARFREGRTRAQFSTFSSDAITEGEATCGLLGRMHAQTVNWSR